MKLLPLITIIITLSGNLLAQSADILVPSVTDTVFRYQGINPFLKYNYNDYDFYTPIIFSITESENLPEGPNESIQLRTELALSYPTTFSTSSTDEIHFMLPFYNRYLENSKLDPVRYVLGMAQAAAVGYLAYRHIKKYGFWK
jgi:hypothetical protein